MTVIDRILGSGIPFITYAVPFFFLLIGVELVVSWLTRRELYRFNDSISDLSCGIIDQVTRVFLEIGLFAGYLYLFQNFRLFEMQNWSPAGKWGAAIALLFGQDLCFYWFHRIAHEYASPWATHVVHHSSEEYNLSVALRQSAFECCFAWMFYLPLAVLGFPPLWYAAIASINLLYQFWVHTEAIDRLGPLEWIMNTPSHHRVHHARNPKYLDKNYAGMFIIWDRMFGTFQQEEEQPVYGLTRPLHSWNPLWANMHGWVDLWNLARRAPYWTDKIRIWFMPLGWMPRGVEPYPRAQEVTRETLKKYNPRVSLRLNLYVLFQFLLVLAIAIAVIDAAEQGHPRLRLVIPAVGALWALLNLGGIFERRPWVIRSEVARIVATLAGAILYAGGTPWLNVVAAIAAGWAVTSLIWLWSEHTSLVHRDRAARRDMAEPHALEPPRAAVLQRQ